MEDKLKLKEFKDAINFIYDSARDYDRDNLGVCISIDEPSVGASACVPVSSVFRGIDWEQGRVDINSGIPIVRKGRSMADAIEPWIHEYDYGDKRKTVIMDCKMCGGRVRKDDRYCSKCGQKLR